MRSKRGEPSIDRALRELRRAVLMHPLAARAIFAALVREGKAYGQTPEGAELRERLSRSELVQRIRGVWDTTTFGVLDAHSDGDTLPSVLVESLARAALLESPEAKAFEALEHEEPWLG